MICAGSYIVALLRPGFQREGQQIAFFTGGGSRGRRYGSGASIARADNVGRVDVDMAPFDRNRAPRDARCQPQIDGERA